MRIAVAGTHCSGKTTLSEDFIAAHPEYVLEPEPYEWLVELYNEEISSEPTIDDFYRQLEVSVARLGEYERHSHVLLERSPVDFLAYMLALHDLGRAHGRDLVTRARCLAAEGLRHVDLLVVLPLNEQDRIVVPENEDPELRSAMNERLVELVTPDSSDLCGVVEILELQGSRRDRLVALEHAVYGTHK